MKAVTLLDGHRRKMINISFSRAVYSMRKFKIFIFIVAFSAVCTGCDTVQTMKLQLYPLLKQKTLTVSIGATALQQLQPITGSVVAVKVVHEQVDDCAGIHAEKKTSTLAKVAIRNCLDKHPPKPATFLRAKKFSDHDNNGEFTFNIGTPGHWSYLVLLQITTPDGVNHYTHAYTHGDSNLTVMIPRQERSRGVQDWGFTVVE